MLCYYASNQSINQSASLLQTPLLILLSSEINFKTNQLFQTKEKEKNNKFACIDSLSVFVQQNQNTKMKKRKRNDKNSGGAIANNKGRHQTDGPGGEELEELGESAGEDG